MHPVNAGVRFVAELVAWYGVGAGLWSVAPVVGIVGAAAAVGTWAVFRVPGDPGPAPVAVPGPVRLAIEAVVLGGGAVGLRVAHGWAVGAAFAAVLVAHHATTPRRLRFVWAGGAIDQR